ncbi:MAG: Succinylglutamate desuccinylase [Candidatus Celerinatantimonas neptuna]|nr:MAG: Succinylglutamate desuccinylase [Candidatus Celerinatantimonas neptuna]
MLPFTNDYLAYLLENPDYQKPAEGRLSDDSRVRLLGAGAIEIIPARVSSPQKVIVLSAGVHGNETAPVEWLNQLLNDLINEELRLVHPLLLLFGHPLAMIAGQRELDHNLNRLFNGAYRDGDSIEHRRAAELETWLDYFYLEYPGRRYHYDLHTAIRKSVHEKFAVVPYMPNRPYHLDQLNFLQHCGVDCLLFFHQPTTTFSYHSALNYQADAFTVELGQVHPFGQNDLTRLWVLDQSMRQLLSREELVLEPLNLRRCQWYQVTDVINREQSDFKLNFAHDLPNFTEFNSQDVVAFQANREVIVVDGPKGVVFPNAHVQVGQRAAILVKVMSTEQCIQFIDRNQ